MQRATAFGIGAAMQVFTRLPWLLLVDQPTDNREALKMIGARVINLAVANS